MVGILIILNPKPRHIFRPWFHYSSFVRSCGVGDSHCPLQMGNRRNKWHCLQRIRLLGRTLCAKVCHLGLLKTCSCPVRYHAKCITILTSVPSNDLHSKGILSLAGALKTEGPCHASQVWGGALRRREEIRGSVNSLPFALDSVQPWLWPHDSILSCQPIC